MGRGRLRELLREESQEAREATRAVRDGAQARRRAARTYRAARDEDVAAMGGRNDEGRAAFRRAGKTATMGPMMEATLDPVTAPEETAGFAAASTDGMESFVVEGDSDAGVDGMVSGLGGSRARVDDLVLGDGSGEALDMLDMGVDL